MLHEKRLRAALAHRYEIHEEIGSGGMATVYLARDLKHDRQVAVKVLRPEFSASLGAERFLKEIGIAAKLTHPHILPVFDSGREEGLLYYVTPYVKGRSLRDRLEEKGPLPVAQAVDLTRQIAEALSHAHDEGVVHRDIKPENILLEAGKPVIADFGIARALSTAADTTLTATGVSVGTPQYMSPEQGAAAGKVDGRADLYALGCMLYEMLTGEPPFSDSNSQVVLAKQMSSPPPSPMSRRPETPVWLDGVVLRLLEKDPEDRYPTARHLAADLTAITDPELGSFSDPFMRWLYRLHKHRRGALLGALSVAAGALVLMLIMEPFPPPEGEFPSTSLAVLPLLNLTGEDESILATGLTTRLTEHLASLQPLSVVSPGTMREHLRTGLPVDSILRRYRVGTLIEGTLAADEGRIQVSLGITDAETGAQIASIGPLTRARTDLIPLFNDLAEEVGRLLRRRLGIELTRRESAAGTDCSECLESLFRAQDLRGQARGSVLAGQVEEARAILSTADSILRSIQAMDPNWIDPVVEQGWVEVLKARLFTAAAGSYDAESCHRGIAHAERALQINRESPKALELRGILLSYLAENSRDPAEQERLWTEARGDLERAVELDPSAAAAWSRLSYLHRQNGRFQEAKTAAERALAADAWLVNDENIVLRLCQASLDLEELEDAYRWCIEEGRTRFPDRTGFVSSEMILMAGWDELEPDVVRGWALADTLIQLLAPHRQETMRPVVLMDVAAIIARAGLPDSARVVVRRARESASSRVAADLDYREANVRLHLGEPDEAIRLLDRYLSARPGSRAYVARDWWFKPLRDDPAFQALLEDSLG